MVKPPTMMNANVPALKDGFVMINFEYHVTEQHARTIVEMVGGRILEMRELLEDLEQEGRGRESWATYLEVLIAVEPSRTQEVVDRLRADSNVLRDRTYKGNPPSDLNQTEEVIFRDSGLANTFQSSGPPFDSYPIKLPELPE